ncbi:hypothetical protein V8E36_003576 [Tilletia maclaganii]
MPFGCGYERRHRYDAFDAYDMYNFGDDYSSEGGSEDDFGSDYYSDDQGVGIDSGLKPAGEESGLIASLATSIAAVPSQHDNRSVSAVADQLPTMPGLVLDGVGRIALPFVDKAKADAIARLWEKNRVERGGSTTKDKQKRTWWDFGADKVNEFENPDWPAAIQRVISRAIGDLGLLSVPVRMGLWKLVLYKEGAELPERIDQQMKKVMFANMIVQLPSVHVGGALQVFKAGTTTPVTHDFGHASEKKAFACHYALHYADSEYAMSRITSGYRVALFYAVLWPKDHPTPAPINGIDIKPTPELVKCLLNFSQQKRQFHYYFEHDYPEKAMAEQGADAP